mmetsp:Transcript_2813/g.6048  ORF Transcript_2813/g.6048 Transcript_2813/m.6048 type:complete len:246 (-) Transcript_2813:1050-1787(-)
MSESLLEDVDLDLAAAAADTTTTTDDDAINDLLKEAETLMQDLPLDMSGEIEIDANESNGSANNADTSAAINIGGNFSIDDDDDYNGNGNGNGNSNDSDNNNDNDSNNNNSNKKRKTATKATTATTTSATRTTIKPPESVGVDAMDEEHRICTDSFNRAAKDPTVETLEELHDILKSHFDHEEELISKHTSSKGSFSSLDSHRMDHQRILRIAAAELGRVAAAATTSSCTTLPDACGMTQGGRKE